MVAEREGNGMGNFVFKRKFEIFEFLVIPTELLIVGFFVRLDPDPLHSGFVYAQALAVKQGLLPAKNFISPYGLVGPFLNGIWVKFVNDSLLSLLLLYGIITIACGFMLQKFISRIISLRIAILANFVWVFTLSTAMPWPSLLTTFLSLLGIYLLYSHSESLKDSYKGSYLFLGPVVLSFQLAILTRIHLVVTPIVVSCFLVIFRKSINKRFVRQWFLWNIAAGLVLLLVLVATGILRPFINQVVIWPLTKFENPHLNLSFVGSLIWFPASLVFMYILISTYSWINSRNQSLKVNLVPVLLTIALFWGIHELSQHNYYGQKTDTLKSLPGIIKNASNNFQFLPFMASCMVCLIGLPYINFVHLNQRLSRPPSDLFQIWLINALAVTGFVQLYPLHDNAHLWFVAPLIVIPAIFSLVKIYGATSEHHRSLTKIIACFVVIQLCIFAKNTEVIRVNMHSSELNGLMASPNYSKSTDNTLLLLDKAVKSRDLRNKCAASLFSVSDRKYRSIDGNFSQGFFSNLTTTEPVVDPSSKQPSQIFICGIDSLQIQKMVNLGYRMDFKVSYPSNDVRNTIVYNVLFDRP